MLKVSKIIFLPNPKMLGRKISGYFRNVSFVEMNVSKFN